MIEWMLWSYEKFAIFGFILTMLMAPITVECGNNKKGVKSTKKSMKKKEKTKGSDESESVKKTKKKTRKSKKTEDESDEDDVEKSIKLSKKKKKPGKATKKPPPKTNAQFPVEEYKAPPEWERPKHPGFEMPLDEIDEHKTERQVYKFVDAQDFV
ncbi:unnamed protein product [Caenorhabditis sp. 36 PRJEB53466]|nr:unnamed protein product [Caenorhabditis sp. 36 PRJEB53466]